MNPKSQDSYTQAYNRWITAQTPEALADLVSEFYPTINAEIQQYSGPKELLRSRAKSFVIQAIRSYDPLGPTKLNSWVVTNLKQLSRYGKRLRPIRASENVIRNAAELGKTTAELEDTLGRKPTDDELQDATGWSKKELDRIRAASISTVSQGTMSQADDEQDAIEPSVNALDKMPFIQESVYRSLNDRDKAIFDYKMGTNRHKTLSGKDIARKLGVTPAYISQRASSIGSLIAGLGG